MYVQALVRDSLAGRAILLAAALLLLSLSAAQAADVKWYTRVEDAQAAAAQSGKPVYLFIFAPSQKACQLMRTQTLSSPAIAAFLSANFECCAVDSVLTVNKAIIDRFGRFPHRNRALGRPSTAEETAFLATPGGSSF